MAERALELLASIERRELDRERRTLAAKTAEIEAEATALLALKEAFGRELGLGLGLPDGPRLAAAFAEASRAREKAMAARLEALERDRAGMEEAVLQRVRRLKTFELAAERRAALAREAAEQRAQARLDEAAGLRHAVRLVRGRQG